MQLLLTGKIMAEGTIDLKKLTIDELSGVVNIYPWFGAARKELCERMAAVAGEEDHGGKLFADAALYIPCRRKLSDILSKGMVRKYTDEDVEKLIRKHLEENNGNAHPLEETGCTGNADYHRDVHIAGGDYFSKADYEGVRRKDDNLFRNIGSASDGRAKVDQPVPHLGFYTQTLAEIYAEQGYFEEAKQIYSQLILAYPEKSAYFASLIEKLSRSNSATEM